MPAAVDDAICIRHWDWSETSQTVSMLTRSHGVIRGIAKGSKRENARFSGGIELLTRGQLLFIAKPTSDLATLTEWDLAEIFPGLRLALRRFYAAMFVADLVQHSIQDHDPHPAAFDATLSCLRALGTPSSDPDLGTTFSSVDQALARFQWVLLTETGYRPQITSDVRTSVELSQRERYLFAPHLGGLLDAAPDPSVPTWAVRGETIECLRMLSSTSISEHSPETWERAARLLAAYFREVLAQPLASLHQVFAANSLPRALRSR